MSPPVILLVDDNPLVLESIQVGLEENNFKVITATSAQQLREKIKVHKVDTVLLDLILPDADGLHLIEDIKQFTNAPIIVVSGRNDLVDKVMGLEMGADDYIAKPFRMRELVARVKAHTRRFSQQKQPQDNDRQPTKLRFGPWVMDCSNFQIFDDQDRSGNLTFMEFCLLEALLLSPKRTLSRAQLLAKARQNDIDTFDRAIDVQVARIRKKLNRNSTIEFIKTVRGVGYMFAIDVEEEN